MIRLDLVEKSMPTGSKNSDVLLGWVLDSLGLVKRKIESWGEEEEFGALHRIMSEALLLEPLKGWDIRTLGDVCGLSQTGMHHQILKLRESGLISSENYGRWHIYVLRGGGITSAINLMAVQAKEASERLAEIVRYHENLAGQQSEATQEKRTIESLQNRLDEMGAHHDTALAIQQKESSEKFADAVRQHENAVEQLRREHDAARSESTQLKTKMIASHSAMLHQAAEEYMAKIDNLKADHIREMDRKEEQHKRELTLKSLKRMVAVGNRTNKEQQQAFFWRWYSAVAVPVETLLRENPVLAEQLRCGMNGAARRKRRPLKSPALKHSKYSMNSANLSAIGLRTPRVRDSRARAGSTGGKFRPARLEAHIEAEGEGAEWKELVEFW